MNCILNSWTWGMSLFTNMVHVLQMEFFQVLCMVKICKINTQNVPSLASKMVLESVTLKISLWEAQMYILRPLSKHTAKPRSQLLSIVKSKGNSELRQKDILSFYQVKDFFCCSFVWERCMCFSSLFWGEVKSTAAITLLSRWVDSHVQKRRHVPSKSRGQHTLLIKFSQ